MLMVIFLNGACDRSDNDSNYIPTLPNQGFNGLKYQTVIEDFEIESPFGETIYGIIRRPDPERYPQMSFAAVVKVPGGINPGRMEALSSDVILAAEAGMLVVCFNAQGRIDLRTCDNPDDETACSDIRSEGHEDYNGFRNQDTLAGVFEYTINLEYVISDNVGLWSQSYGITMAAGCAARHPGLPIKYIVDGEGPSCSFVTVQEPWALFSDPAHPNHYKYKTVHGIFGRYSTARDPRPENLAFWEEREAIRYIGSFRGMYVRLQAEWDHSQPPRHASEIGWFDEEAIWYPWKHTCDMVNAAVAGGVPWVRVNLPEQDNAVNDNYDYFRRLVPLPGELKDRPYAVQAVLEMANADPV
jgi:hypothetical protein